MSVKGSPAVAIETRTPAASQPPTTTAVAPWRQRANSELEKIVALFSSKQLPGLCAKALINSPGKPSSKWSLGNQILVLLAGTYDARGFRQWNEVGRSVTKGAKAFYILGPVRKRIRRKTLDEHEGQSEEFADVLVGFMPVPVFRY